MIRRHASSQIAGSALLAALILGAAPVLAQTPSLSPSDAAFLKTTAQGSIYEEQLSVLGLERGTTPMVRQYAQALVLDHATFNVNLMSLVNAASLIVPVTASADDMKRLSTLLTSPATSFDASFLTEEARINRQDIADETKALASTQDPQMKSLVGEMLSGDRFHDMLARQLMMPPAASP